MTQSLWYLRHEGKVYGPFPAPQINESLKTGKVTPDWEISLDENEWLSIAESDQFELEQPARRRRTDLEEQPWRDERERARQRWQSQSAESDPPVIHDPALDERTRLSVSRDHIRTEALLQADKAKRRSPWGPLLGGVALLILGVVVWWGQTEEPIKAGIQIGLAVDCEQPLVDGVNWKGCDKHGHIGAGVSARNARLEGARLDEAQLPGADLSYALLRSASLRNAGLGGIKLTGADLSGADLAGADLVGADLRYAILKDANLTGARFDSARLDKAVWVDGRNCAEGSLGFCR